MLTIDTVTSEVLTALPAFGLRIRHAEASCLAALYVYQRPQRPADDVAAMLKNVHGLAWDESDDREIQQLVMRSLVEHLDEQYFVATWEHDGDGSESTGRI